MTIFLKQEFDRIFEKIYKKENFSLLRCADGEYSIATNKSFKSQEYWKSKGDLDFSKAMIESLNINDEKFIYAISCPCCDFIANAWYQTHITSNNLSLSNLFVNINYERFSEYFEKIKEDAILIANFRAKNKKIGNLNILKHYEISDNCIDFFHNDLEELIKNIKQDFGNKKNLLYVISAGPLSAIIIYKLFKFNPNNRYIDFGSSIEFYYQEQKILRPYMIRGNIYNTRNCYINVSNNKRDNLFNISIILNLHKRPYALQEQLQALQNQSLKPKEILLYQDGVFEGIEIPNEIKNEFNLIEISKESKGVWARFDFAKKNAKYDLVCIFDDDTIPGEDFLANCFNEFQKQEGLYGSNGVVIKNIENPHTTYDGMFNIGCKNPNEETIQVDFVGHTWFFKKEWLNDLFIGTETLQSFKIVGEDMAFSLVLQRRGIKSFVPPHPFNFNKKNLWGSTDDKKFGLKNGISNVSENFLKFDQAFAEAIKLGFKPLIQYNQQAYQKAFKYYKKPINLYLKRILYPFRQPRKFILSLLIKH